jgi:hypothetical protein
MLQKSCPCCCLALIVMVRFITYLVMVSFLTANFTVSREWEELKEHFSSVPGKVRDFSIIHTSLSFLTEAVSNSDYMYSTQNGNIINQSWIWQHAKGSCCGLILCLFCHLPECVRKAKKNLGRAVDNSAMIWTWYVPIQVGSIAAVTEQTVF